MLEVESPYSIDSASVCCCGGQLIETEAYLTCRRCGLVAGRRYEFSLPYYEDDESNGNGFHHGLPDSNGFPPYGSALVLQDITTTNAFRLLRVHQATKALSKSGVMMRAFDLLQKILSDLPIPAGKEVERLAAKYLRLTFLLKRKKRYYRIPLVYAAVRLALEESSLQISLKTIEEHFAPYLGSCTKAAQRAYVTLRLKVRGNGIQSSTVQEYLQEFLLQLTQNEKVQAYLTRRAVPLKDYHQLVFQRSQALVRELGSHRQGKNPRLLAALLIRIADQELAKHKTITWQRGTYRSILPQTLIADVCEVPYSSLISLHQRLRQRGVLA